MLKSLLVLLFALSTSLFAGNIMVKDAYVRAVPPNLPNSASFMKIINNSDKNIYLISAKSTGAKTLELHEHVMSGGMMKMFQVKKIKVPANGMVDLKPGGYHVMFIGLNKVFKAGGYIKKLELKFSDGEIVELHEVPIKNVMQGMMKMKMKKK